ncbi:MAG: hypothetical protein K6T83_08425 [Alicyclobacillus sp.]|nr:hypothetical protein [Alicyclobacillus sp.]
MSGLSAFIMANLIGIASNLDNTSIGIAYGASKIRFPHKVNAVINLVGCCMAWIGACAGEITSRYITPSQAAWASCGVLVCIGLFFWYSAYLHPRLTHQQRGLQIKQPGWKEGLLLGLALSVTNGTSGFGATVASAATVWATVASITVWGYILIWLGNAIGIGILARMMGKYASFGAGLLMIAVGLHQIAGYL